MKFHKFPAAVVAATVMVAVGVLVIHDRNKSQPELSPSAVPASTQARVLDQDIAAGGIEHSTHNSLENAGSVEPESQVRSVLMTCSGNWQTCRFKTRH